jgi:hypothetical protein
MSNKQQMNVNIDLSKNIVETSTEGKKVFAEGVIIT